MYPYRVKEKPQQYKDNKVNNILRFLVFLIECIMFIMPCIFSSFMVSTQPLTSFGINANNSIDSTYTVELY